MKKSSKFHQTIKNFYAVMPKKVEKICEHNFFLIFCATNLKTFLLTNYIKNVNKK